MSDPEFDLAPTDLETDSGIDTYVSALGGTGANNWEIWQVLIGVGIDQYRAAAAVNRVLGPDRQK